MVEMALADVSPWAGLWRRGRFGRTGPEPGVVIAEPPRSAAATLLARKGQEGAVLAAAAAWGVELPTRPAWAMGGPILFVWTGPGQWLVRGLASFSDLEADLAGFAASAVLINQSHGRAVVSVGGPNARDVLAKGFEIDLHPRAFQPGDAAVTVAAGISAILWQLDDRPTYEIAVPRSMAGSLWHWLSASAAEFGYQVGEDG